MGEVHVKSVESSNVLLWSGVVVKRGQLKYRPRQPLFKITRAAGIAIYRKQKHSHVVTPHKDIIYRQTSERGIASEDIGDICEAECIFENGQAVISVTVYISPNQAVQ
ncbi:hypothetical protein TNCV_1943391 [Trichonephila clavipes]|nr:hypothetical protein TNCV_1943391 [Trichonephila clavipes]